MDKNQRGFSVVEGLLIFVIVGILCGTGWYVYSSNKKTNDLLNSADNSEIVNPAKTTQKKENYVVPEGYKVYENKDLGFKFAYPLEYGEFKTQPTMNGVQINQANEPATKYGPGINGNIIVYSSSSPSVSIIGRKYGPKIKLENGQWIVSEASELDTIKNKVGDIYKDFDNKIPDSQKNGGLTIYTLKSGDEGVEMYRLVFVASNKLHEISLPAFSDGGYGNSDPNFQGNDKTKFNELLNNIRNSVLLVK